MSEMTDAYVKLDKVSKIYGTKEVKIVAVDEISFEIAKGEFVVIVGPSGAGKTTVLNILGGMDKATSGEVLVDGRNIARYNSKQLTGYRRNDIGFVFQFYNLVPNLTALENVELALQICKNPLDARKICYFLTLYSFTAVLLLFTNCHDTAPKNGPNFISVHTLPLITTVTLSLLHTCNAFS